MRVLQEDADGNRKVSFYGQAGLLLEEDLSTGKIKEYIHAGGELIAHDGSDGLLYYHNDHLGSPVAASNAQGALQWRAHFRPYGERQAEGGAGVGSIGYTGHMQDDASGLVYAGARYYDPVVGRFLAIDPVGVDAGKPVSFNRYAYGNNSPYGYVDPDGRSPVVAMEIVVVGALVLTGAAIVNSNGWSTAFPAHQGGGEVYGGSSIDPTLSGPWHTGRPASGFNWPTWMSSEESGEVVKGSAGGIRAGKSFTSKGKAEIESTNAEQYGGGNVCENCGAQVVQGKKSQRGVTPPGNERHRDHIIPKSKGGDGSPSNGQILCRTCNLGKSDKL